jgi:hypothetical protein
MKTRYDIVRVTSDIYAIALETKATVFNIEGAILNENVYKNVVITLHYYAITPELLNFLDTYPKPTISLIEYDDDYMLSELQLVIKLDWSIEKEELEMALAFCSDLLFDHGL